MENIITIYRSLDATFSDSLFLQTSSDAARVSEPHQASLDSNFNAKVSKDPFQITKGDNLSCSDKEQVRVPLTLHHPVQDGKSRNQKNEKCNTPMDGKAGNFEMSSEREFDFRGSSNPNSEMLSSKLEVGQYDKSGIMEIDMNQVTQLSPEIPPFRDSKGSESECSNQDSQHKLESSSVKGGIKETGNSERRMIHLRPESYAPEWDDRMRTVKRQKKMSCRPLDQGLKSDDHIQPGHLHSSNHVASISELKLKSGENIVAFSDDSYANKSICSFCQSSKASEDTGPMLHYANGTSVVGDAAVQPNVIHVHKVCIDWAPQVYFVPDVVKNLKAEVARGAKLKCSRCGLKGAALGCYVNSCRRTYHVPCAMKISDCRWDCDNFRMLCPAHSSVEFPNEKSKRGDHNSKNHSMSTPLYGVFCLAVLILIPMLSNFWVAPADGVKKLVFCGSALSTEEKIHLVKFGVTVTKFWTPNVTHVIAATDANGVCSRTLKVLMAILHGRWVLKIDWINACMEAKHLVEEEPYEVSLDNYGCRGGPKAGRLKALANEPKLFCGLSFYFSGDFVPAYKEDLLDLVLAGEGIVLESKEELVSKSHDCRLTPSKLLVVYSLDPPEGCKLGDEVSILWERLKEAEDVADKTGSQVSGHSWILESIASCKLQPFSTDEGISAAIPRQNRSRIIIS
ncbi:Protein BREAST CANCER SUSCEPTIBILITY 1-like protein [Quillaja saponaria]|uniref:Protein BREAST CANCER SUSCEPTIBILITY 1-like protein n=1 Tax=Quillaja saponaria TaxID=32244 RepID=A0AAD7Q0J2_QUISA|nr:Protein BREAST CANCER SUSCEPTIBILITY 1-like protein [Quillaja saponaria]